VAVVDDLKQQREQLEKELLLASEAFERACRPIASGGRADLGPVRYLTEDCVAAPIPAVQFVVDDPVVYRVIPTSTVPSAP
jgi:hypothetical protein